MSRPSYSRLSPYLAAAGAYAGLSAYYRFRPEPPGINPPPRTVHVPVENISFYHDTTYLLNDRRTSVRQIADEVTATIRAARRFVLADVFLFNLHHVADRPDGISTTRQIVDAFRGKEHPSCFITDPLNTTYGSAECEPLKWLVDEGVQVCITNLEKLRDNNLLYAPLWHLLFKHIPSYETGIVPNPLLQGQSTSGRAVLQALTLRSNHRKILIADQDDSCATIVTSSNFEDASCYFGNTAVKIRSTPVARQYLNAEVAVARMSGCDAPAGLGDAIPAEARRRPRTPNGRTALVTPLMGRYIKRALLRDLSSASRGDDLFVCAIFIADRDVVDALVEACRRGAAVHLVLDQNQISFGSKKFGFPNKMVSAELDDRSNASIRWANTGDDEYHAKLLALRTDRRLIIHTGSANLTRRSLSGTNLEANVRISAPLDSSPATEVLDYMRRMNRSPFSIPFRGGNSSAVKYAWYRFQEASGIATF